MVAIKKEDVIICTYDGNMACGEGASKLSEIDLNNYKPYFVIDYMSAEEINNNFNNGQYPSWLEKTGSDELIRWMLPAAEAVKFLWGTPCYCIASMETISTYPDVSASEYTIEPVKDEQENPFEEMTEEVPGDYLNVYSTDQNGNITLLSIEREKVFDGILDDYCVLGRFKRGVEYYTNPELTGGKLTEAEIKALAPFSYIWEIVPLSTIKITVATVDENGNYDFNANESTNLEKVIERFKAGTVFYKDNSCTELANEEDIKTLYNGAWLYIPDGVIITIVDIGYEQKENKFKKNLLEYFDLYTDCCTYYKDANKIKELTKDDITAIEEDTTIYRYSKSLTVYLIRDGEKNPTANSYTLWNLITQFLNWGTPIYCDETCTTAYTKENLIALEEGSTVYLK